MEPVTREQFERGDRRITHTPTGAFIATNGMVNMREPWTDLDFDPEEVRSELVRLLNEWIA